MTQVSNLPVRACPKCGHASDVSNQECPACGVVIAKAARNEPAAEPRSVPRSPLAPLEPVNHLIVKQQVERLEAWTGIETANEYTVKDGMGRVVFDVVEESGNAGQLLGRLFLKAARPFTMHIATPWGEPVCKLNRPFRFLFHEVQVQDILGRPLGTVRKQLSFVNRRYLLTGEREPGTYEIFGPLLRPWTFKIRRDGRECGLITKKWSGLGKETFTDADSFGVQLPPDLGVEMKAVFLGAVFLIDFAHFEDNN